MKICHVTEREIAVYKSDSDFSDVALDEVAVMSSWIADLDYYEGDTYITLNNGRQYMVKNTRPEVYNRWLKSPSKGKFWHSDIKGMHQVRRIK